MKVLENLMKWQNYMHYLLLTVFIAVFSHFLGVHVFHTASFMPNINFIKLYLVLFIGDSLVHFIFSVLPEPFKWED